MNKPSASIIRNLIIFSVIIIISGWLYNGLNQVIPSPNPQQSLGLLLWILTPPVTVLLLRGLGKDGWADFGLGLKLKDNLGWYALALLVYPLGAVIVLGLGALFGQVSLTGLASQGTGALMQLVGFGFVGSIIKNIAEEFAWRGYLTPRFKAVGLPDLANHLLTGLIWGLWHIPYWLYLLGPETIKSVTSINMFWFILLALAGIFPTALVYGELRLKTGSVWPAWLAHNMVNALGAQLILAGFIKLNNQSAEVLFDPSPGGLLMIILFWLLGLWMMQQKTNRQ
jgi:membrane protease YdiL (CAAX protease family)